MHKEVTDHDFTFLEHDNGGLETLVSISKADAFNKWMYDVIAPFLHGSILEIGSGIGNISRYFIAAGSRITLSDIRENYCRQLQSTFGNNAQVQNIDLVHADFHNIYKEHIGRYDSLFALNVVEHIKDDVLALKNAAALLKPGGTVVVLVPAFPFLYNSLDKELYHYRRYIRSDLNAKLRSAGLHVAQSFYFNALGMAGWFVSGLMQRKLISGKQMTAFNAVVPVAKMGDALLKRIMGLSLIAVGKKPSDV